MKRIIISLGAMAVLFGAMSSPLLAASRGSRGGHSGHGHHGDHGHYGRMHGLHHGAGGYWHRDYRGWSRSYWNTRYRCTWYFCPESRCYYYYYAPSSCYLPASQIATYPPTINIVNNNNNNLNVAR